MELEPIQEDAAPPSSPRLEQEYLMRRNRNISTNSMNNNLKFTGGSTVSTNFNKVTDSGGENDNDLEKRFDQLGLLN